MEDLRSGVGGGARARGTEDASRPGGRAWPQQPKAMDRPFSLFGDGFAWYSMDGSLSEFRQMAHVSAQMSQLHMHTAFHLRVAVRLAGRAARAAGRRGRAS